MKVFIYCDDGFKGTFGIGRNTTALELKQDLLLARSTLKLFSLTQDEFILSTEGKNPEYLVGGVTVSTYVSFDETGSARILAIGFRQKALDISSRFGSIKQSFGCQLKYIQDNNTGSCADFVTGVILDKTQEYLAEIDGYFAEGLQYETNVVLSAAKDAFDHKDIFEMLHVLERANDLSSSSSSSSSKKRSLSDLLALPAPTEGHVKATTNAKATKPVGSTTATATPNKKQNVAQAAVTNNDNNITATPAIAAASKSTNMVATNSAAQINKKAAAVASDETPVAQKPVDGAKVSEGAKISSNVINTSMPPPTSPPRVTAAAAKKAAAAALKDSADKAAALTNDVSAEKLLSAVSSSTANASSSSSSVTASAQLAAEPVVTSPVKTPAKGKAAAAKQTLVSAVSLTPAVKEKVPAVVAQATSSVAVVKEVVVDADIAVKDTAPKVIAPLTAASLSALSGAHCARVTRSSSVNSQTSDNVVAAVKTGKKPAAVAKRAPVDILAAETQMLPTQMEVDGESESSGGSSSDDDSSGSESDTESDGEDDKAEDTKTVTAPASSEVTKTVTPADALIAAPVATGTVVGTAATRVSGPQEEASSSDSESSSSSSGSDSEDEEDEDTKSTAVDEAKQLALKALQTAKSIVAASVTPVKKPSSSSESESESSSDSDSDDEVEKKPAVPAAVATTPLPATPAVTLKPTSSSSSSESSSGESSSSDSESEDEKKPANTSTAPNNSSSSSGSGSNSTVTAVAPTPAKKALLSAAQTPKAPPAATPAAKKVTIGGTTSKAAAAQDDNSSSDAEAPIQLEVPSALKSLLIKAPPKKSPSHFLPATPGNKTLIQAAAAVTATATKQARELALAPDSPEHSGNSQSDMLTPPGSPTPKKQPAKRKLNANFESVAGATPKVAKNVSVRQQNSKQSNNDGGWDAALKAPAKVPAKPRAPAAKKQKTSLGEAIFGAPTVAPEKDEVPAVAASKPVAQKKAPQKKNTTAKA